MLCNNFKCVHEDLDGECLEMGGECLPDFCEIWGECISCQKQDGSDDCWKDQNSRSGPDPDQDSQKMEGIY